MEVNTMDFLNIDHTALKELLRMPSFEDDLDTVKYSSVDERGDIISKVKILKCKQEKFHLPVSDSYFNTATWKLLPMQILEDELNNVKSLLNDIRIDIWHDHTRKMNITSPIISEIRKCFSHEFCSIAWCKLFEILSLHNAIPRVTQEAAKQLDEILLHSIHLCEAPGAFISALNHYLKTKYSKVNWKWIATTLNPYFEGNGISDALIQDEIILSTYNNWAFLEDNTGNIMNYRNIMSLGEKARKLKYVQLVTADGSIDCADSPDEQETVTSDLHFCEIMAALVVLEKGGSFVLKMFTFFTCNSISKLYLLSCLFEECVCICVVILIGLHLGNFNLQHQNVFKNKFTDTIPKLPVEAVKPTMSKPGNSEVYIICRGYMGPEYLTQEKSVLLNFVGAIPKGMSMFPVENIPKEFLNRVIDSSVFFTTCQVREIQRNVKVFPFREMFYSQLWHTKDVLAKSWLQNTQLAPLQLKDFIFNLSNTKKTFCFKNVKSESFSGSYNERVARNKKRNQLAWIIDIENELESIVRYLKCNSVILILPSVTNFSLTWGKQFENVKGSRFCDDKILQLNQTLRQFTEYCFDSFEYDTTLKTNIVFSCSHAGLVSHVNLYDDEVQNNKINREYILPEIMCYNDDVTFEDLRLSDSSISGNYFKRLHISLKGLHKGQALFLCSFPLLTRLHFGMVILISNFFQSGKIYYEAQPKKDGQKSIRGIFYRNFRGFAGEHELWKNMQNAFSACAAKDLPLCVQEVVPVACLCRKKLCNTAMMYNNKLILENVQDKVKAVQQFFILKNQKQFI